MPGQFVSQSPARQAAQSPCHLADSPDTARMLAHLPTSRRPRWRVYRQASSASATIPGFQMLADLSPVQSEAQAAIAPIFQLADQPHSNALGLDLDLGKRRDARPNLSHLAPSPSSSSPHSAFPVSLIACEILAGTRASTGKFLHGLPLMAGLLQARCSIVYIWTRR